MIYDLPENVVKKSVAQNFQPDFPFIAYNMGAKYGPGYQKSFLFLGDLASKAEPFLPILLAERNSVEGDREFAKIDSIGNQINAEKWRRLRGLDRLIEERYEGWNKGDFFHSTDRVRVALHLDSCGLRRATMSHLGTTRNLIGAGDDFQEVIISLYYELGRLSEIDDYKEKLLLLRAINNLAPYNEDHGTLIQVATEEDHNPLIQIYGSYIAVRRAKRRIGIGERLFESLESEEPLERKLGITVATNLFNKTPPIPDHLEVVDHLIKRLKDPSETEENIDMILGKIITAWGNTNSVVTTLTNFADSETRPLLLRKKACQMIGRMVEIARERDEKNLSRFSDFHRTASMVRPNLQYLSESTEPGVQVAARGALATLRV